MWTKTHVSTYLARAYAASGAVITKQCIIQLDIRTDQTSLESIMVRWDFRTHWLRSCKYQKKKLY